MQVSTQPGFLSTGAACRSSRFQSHTNPLPAPLSTPLQLFALTEALAEDPNIEAIDLSYNFIDDNGAGSLASFLQVQTRHRSIPCPFPLRDVAPLRELYHGHCS